MTNWEIKQPQSLPMTNWEIKQLQLLLMKFRITYKHILSSKMIDDVTSIWHGLINIVINIK
jgi:hypothetical protein